MSASDRNSATSRAVSTHAPPTGGSIAWSSAWSIGGWGVFCAASWTWCIGMYLPLVMLRDDGWMGFLAFAIPNVIGCAAFGYVRSRNACRTALRVNAPALRLFSIVTVAYQLFFVGFVLTALAPTTVSPFAIAIVVLLVASGLGGPRRFGGRSSAEGGDGGRIAWPTLMAIGVVVWIASMVLFALLLAGAGAGAVGGGGMAGAVAGGGVSDFGAFGRLEPSSLTWIVPILAFGFLLCPYLDGTFHVARIHSPSRHAFAVFGVAFALMLLLSASYASLLLHHGMVWPVLVHMLIQLTFSCGVHIRVMHDLRPASRQGSSLPWLAWIVAPLVGIAVVPAVAAGIDPMAGPVPGESWYMRWLALYGIVFPALVLLLRRRPFGDPTARTLPMAIAVVIGLVLCEFGVIQGHRWLVPFGVAGPLLVGFWPARTTAGRAEARASGGGVIA